MHILKIIVLLLISASFACSSDTKKPEKVNFSIIPEKTMLNILFDIHMHDGIINAYNNQDQSNIFLSKDHYDSTIFLKYGVTDTLFKLNLEHYTIQGKIKVIYTDVIDSMNNVKAHLDQKRQQKINANRQK